MEILYFTIVGAALYLGSEWILDRVEQARGARFPHRSLIFFAIIFCLAMVAFSAIERLTTPDTPPMPAAETVPGIPPVIQK
ncbi:MAG: hypothetical protein H7837_05820 [Magnetococcus sp. MYC-9]